VAAFRLGAPRGVDLTYFAAAGSTTKHLETVEGRLVPTSTRLERAFARTSGGQTAIDASDYDAFMLVGMVALADVMQVAMTHRPLRYAVRSEVALVSDECFGASLRGVTRRSMAGRTLDKLREVTTAPVVVVPAPLPSIDVCRHPRRGEVWSTPGLVREFKPIYDDALSQLGVPVVLQPEHTIHDDIFTNREFARGSLRLREVSDEHAESECFHMNGEFGAIMAHAALDTLGSVAGGAVDPSPGARGGGGG
jgi:hypothetical protein